MKEINVRKSEYESYLRRNLGMILIKPDSVKLGIAENVIDFAISKVQESGIGEINGVYIVQINKQDIAEIYSTVKAGVGEVLKNYMTEDLSVLLTFKGNGNDDIWDFLHSIRGKRLMDRTPEELDSGMAMKNGIRDWIPLPSTRNKYKSSFETLKERYRRGDKSNIINFSDADYSIYCQNLVHVPDDLREIVALLQLLNQDEIIQNISKTKLEKIKETIK